MNSNIKSNHQLSIKNAVIWSAKYVCIILFTEIISIAIVRKYNTTLEPFINFLLFLLLGISFFIVLRNQTSFKIDFFYHATASNILISLACAFLLYFLLDKGIDPILENSFPQSEFDYQNTIKSLLKTPYLSFLHVCIAAPIIEELLMRGFILGGLQKKYGVLTGLFVSSLLFAVLHFNMVQTFSALFCGVIIGLLYLKTGSLFCCILTHSTYNMISYLLIILDRY